MVDLLRPEPPRSWRARLAAAASGLSVARLATAAGAVLLVAVTAWWLLRSPAPPVERSLPTAKSLAATGSVPAATGATVAPPPTTAAALVVQAAGAVTTPGVYRVPPGSRVLDVVTAAGGPTSTADLGAVALAAKVVDGQRVYVPQRGEPPPATTPGGGPGPPPAPLDLNAADRNALEGLPGVGPALAQAIVDYRDEHGPFHSIDDLLDVRGIGPAKLDGFRDLVTIGG